MVSVPGATGQRRCHAAVGVADATDGHAVCHDVFRQSHAHIAGITDVMDIGSGHLAGQRNLADGGGIRPFLRSADGRNGQAAQTVGA